MTLVRPTVDSPRQSILFGFAVVIASLMTTSCSKELSRKEAAELIVKESGFLSPVTAELPSHCRRNLSPGHFDLEDQREVERGGISKSERALRELYEPLQAKGLVTYEIVPTMDSFAARGHRLINVTLTQQGEDYRLEVRSDDRDAACSLTSVRTCERDLIAVTGIVGDERAALVQYQWRFANPTPFASIAEDCAKTDPHAAEARFLRYDDGWR